MMKSFIDFKRFRLRSRKYLEVSFLGFAVVLLMILATSCKEKKIGASGQQTSMKDWCVEHRLPESKCTKCNPKLIPKYKKSGDWCRGHGFPESVCPFCHPAPLPPGLKKKSLQKSGSQKTSAKDWCVEHRIPESKCTKCNPKLIPKYKKSGDWCKGHGFPESVCPFCNPAPLPPGIKKRPLNRTGTLIRFRTKGIERAVGIQVAPATNLKLGKALSCTVKIDYNRNRFAEVRSPVPGLLHRLLVNVGQKVKRRSSLFVLSSARISSLKAQLRATKEALSIAKIALARHRRLRKSRISTVRNVEQARLRVVMARSKLASIRQSLRIGGISIRGSGGYFSLLAPISGRVVTRPAVIGSQAGPGILLATLADTRTMWAILNLNEWKAPFVRVGQQVSVRVSGIPTRVFQGKITWISSHVDPTTRVVHARAELKSYGLLRANQFGRATIQIRGGIDGVTVPLQAVQKIDKGSVVFVRLKPGEYETRSVTLGRSDGRNVQLKGKIKVGDKIVTTGAFLLRTELSKGSIGAGCCEVTKKPGGE